MRALDRAAKRVSETIHAEPEVRRPHPDIYAYRVARALRDAGLLATEERDREVAARAWGQGYRDAAVAAKALREAADEIPSWYAVPHATRNFLTDRADRIEEGR